MRDHDSDGHVDDTHCSDCGGELGEGSEPVHSSSCPWHPARAFAKGGIGNRTPFIPAGGWAPAGGADDILDFGPNVLDLLPLTEAMGQNLPHGARRVGAHTTSGDGDAAVRLASRARNAGAFPAAAGLLALGGAR